MTEYRDPYNLSDTAVTDTAAAVEVTDTAAAVEVTGVEAVEVTVTGVEAVEVTAMAAAVAAAASE